MRLLSFLSICVFIIACNTPNELLQKGETNRAFKKALRKLKKEKNVITNTDVIIKAADQIAKNTISYNASLVQSNQLYNWTTAQNNYDKSLKDIFAANDLVNGKLQSSYDELCTEKIELDFKVTDHFYQLGEELLATHYEQLSKHHAREAYSDYHECLSYGGERFFQDIEEKMDECIKEGRIYFISYDFNPSQSLFFKPLLHEEQEPDCVISADFNRPHFTECSSISSQSFSKQIEVGHRSEVDTAGVTHFFPIYENVSGSVKTTTVTVTASSTTYVNVKNVTGYCFKNPRSFRNSISDSYIIVSLCGDKRAIPHCYSEKDGSHAFSKRSLERALDSKIDSDLFFW